MTNPAEIRQPRIYRGPWLYWLALVAVSLPVAFRQVSVSDAWWHIAIGKWLVRERRLPDPDAFYFSPTDSGSIASELRWQWLGDVLLYALHEFIGSFGLQLMSLACLFAAFFFLLKLGRPAPGPWTLLLIGAVTLGTYQLQMPRNSAFSLALYPLLLWLGCKSARPPTYSDYLWLMLLLLVWSFLHGSCVLGWATAVLLFAPRVLAAFVMGPMAEAPHSPSGQMRRVNWQDGSRAAFVYGAVMTMSFVLIAAGRPNALLLVRAPLEYTQNSVAALVFEEAEVAKQGQNTATKSVFASVKSGLNSFVWKRDGSTPWSNDYWSPFSLLPGNKPIEAAFALALLAFVCLLLFRNAPIGLVLAWLASLPLGLGYVRMFGYLAICSAAVILVATRSADFSRWRLLPPVGWGCVAVWIVFAWSSFAAGRMDRFIPEGQHVSRKGKVPIYDDSVADWVISRFPEENVFTTIETGSYCLLRWDFKKRVFIDGFFAPHTREVWDSYQRALKSGDLSPLHDRFGITVAVLPTTSQAWIDRFRLNPDWSPVALGNGTVVFNHSSLAHRNSGPEIFARAEALRASSHYYRYATLKTLFLIASRDYSKSGGFAPTDWTAMPEFGPLRRMASDVFPLVEASVTSSGD